MSQSKKILITPNGYESFVNVADEPATTLELWYMVSNDILKRLFITAQTIDFAASNLVSRVLKSTYQVNNLNGFDYSAAKPDYSLIDKTLIAVESQKDYKTAIDLNLVTNDQNVVDAIGGTCLQLAYQNEADWKQWVQENEAINVVNPDGSANLRQPFYLSIDVDDEVDTGGDGEITVTSAWGGATPLEYSKDDGANWQASNTFSDLSAGDYDVMAKDADGNESIARTITVSDVPSV